MHRTRIISSLRASTARVSFLGTIRMLLLMCSFAGCTPKSGPNSTPASPVLSSTLWARRNIEELSRTPVKAPPREDAIGLYDAIRVSLMMNSMLWNEPYLSQLRGIAKRAAARESDPVLRAPLRDLAAVLELPLPQRLLRLVRRDFDLQKPLISANNENDIVTGIRNAPDDATFDLLVAHFLEPMDQSARAAGRWAQLAGCYYTLSYEAEERKRPALIDLCVRRMVGIFKEHQSYRVPTQSTWGIAPAQAAQLLVELDRHVDLADLIDSSTGMNRFHFVMFRIGQLVQEDQIDQARVVSGNELAPIAPDIADRLLKSMDGQVVSLPPEPKQPLIIGTHRIARETDPQELSLRDILSGMAHHYARTGNLDLASQQLIALQQDTIALPHARTELGRDTWWALCKEARRAGHADVAGVAFEHVMEMYEKEQATRTPETLPVDIHLVREAESLGDWDLVIKIQGSSSITGPVNLARAYRDRGNIVRATELLYQARGAASRLQFHDELLSIAIEMYRIGEREPALDMLRESEQFLNGDIFGMSFVSEFISASIAMEQYDLIERVYARSTDPSQRLLISMVATLVGSMMESGKLPVEN